MGTVTTMSEALELAANYEPPTERWLVKNLLLDGSLNLIVGKPKAGKSRLTAGIVAALTQGTTIGGCPDLEVGQPHRVLWVGSDGGWKGQVKETIRMNHPNALNHVYLLPKPMFTAGLQYGTRTPTSDTNRAWLALADAAIEQGVDVLVIDHLLGVQADRGVNEDTAVSPFLTTLATIGERGITPIVLHHTSERQFGNQSDSAMGHTMITASARQILSLRSKTAGKDVQEVFVRGNETAEMAVLVESLGDGPLKVDWFGRADARPGQRSAAGDGEKQKKKRVRGDLALIRARYILKGPEEVRVNQSAAGKHLEQAPQSVKGDLTDGRQAVKNLISKGLLEVSPVGTVERGVNLTE